MLDLLLLADEHEGSACDVTQRNMLNEVSSCVYVISRFHCA